MTTREVVAKARERVLNGEAYDFADWGRCAVGNVFTAAYGRVKPTEFVTSSPAKMSPIMTEINKALGYKDWQDSVTPLSDSASVTDKPGTSQYARDKAVAAYDRILARLDKAHDHEMAG